MSAAGKYADVLAKNPGGGGMVRQSAFLWQSLLQFQHSEGMNGDLCEIGVYKGYGACLPACFLRNNERMLLIDRYFGLDYARETILAVAGNVLKKIDFLQNDSIQILRNNIVPMTREFRFIHIDGEHSYDAVMSDLRFAADRLAERGVVVIDDFFNFATPQITQAVWNFLDLKYHNLSMFLCGYNKCYLCFSRDLRHYRKFVEELPITLENQGINVQVAVSSFAHEHTYYGLSDRISDHPYQLIGRFSSDVSEL